MNALFAAGLFDSPWIVAALLIGSALVNWLAKRRQEKQARNRPEGEATPPAASSPPGEFNLEETLRRLLGAEPPAPSPAPPPLLPRATPSDLPPADTRMEKPPLPPEWPRKNHAEEAKSTFRKPATPPAPVLRPSVTSPPGSAMARAASRQAEQAAQRFEQLSEQARLPATVVNHTRQRTSRSDPRVTSRWRNPRSVRQAFVASLVFAPPKSFEP